MVPGVRIRQAGDIGKGRAAQLRLQTTVLEPFELQFRHVLPVAPAMIDHFGQRRFLAVSEIVDAKIAIRKAAAVGVDMGEGRHCIMCAADPQHPLLARQQRQISHFLRQAWIG